MRAEEASPLLKADDVATRLRVSRSQAYALIEAGDIAYVRIGHRSVRVTEQALADYIATRTNAPRPARRLRSVAMPS